MRSLKQAEPSPHWGMNTLAFPGQHLSVCLSQVLMEPWMAWNYITKEDRQLLIPPASTSQSAPAWSVSVAWSWRSLYCKNSNWPSENEGKCKSTWLHHQGAAHYHEGKFKKELIKRNKPLGSPKKTWGPGSQESVSMTGHMKCVAAKAEVNNPLKHSTEWLLWHQQYKRSNKATQIQIRENNWAKMQETTSGFTAMHT